MSIFFIVSAIHLQLFEFIDHQRYVSFIDLNEVRVIEKTLYSQELSLFLFFDDTCVLGELHQLFAVLLLGGLHLTFVVNLTEQEVHFVGDAHTQVF